MMAAVRVCVVAVLCLLGLASANTPEQRLRAAIVNPNTKLFTLTESIALTADLPKLPSGKAFELRGRLGGGNKPVTIDGKGQYRMFFTPGDATVKLTLRNLYLTRSKDAAVNMQESELGAKLTVDSVTFDRVPRSLYLSSVVATITNSKILRNTNTAVYLESIEGETDRVTFKNCEFTSNIANNDIGGAAIYATLYATVIIEGSTFSNNNAAYYGGAVRFRTAYGTIRNCKFLNNAAKEQGGAVSVYNGALKIVGTLFKGNTARTQHGGALRVSGDGDIGSFASVASSTFEGNSAPKGFGGAFLLDDGTDLRLCSVTFKQNTDKSGINNGYVTAPKFGRGASSITITTTPKVATKDLKVKVAPGARVAFKSGEKC